MSFLEWLDYLNLISLEPSELSMGGDHVQDALTIVIAVALRVRVESAIRQGRVLAFEKSFLDESFWCLVGRKEK